MGEKLEQVGGSVESRVIYGSVSDDTIRRIRVDKITKYLIGIDQDAAMVHASNAFIATYSVDLATNTTLTLLITTPNTTKYAHMGMDISVEGEMALALYENIAAGTGTSITVYNRDRNSAITAGVLVVHSPGLVTAGTTIIYATAYGASYAGALLSGKRMFALIPNKKYYLLMTPGPGAGSHYATVNLNWFEHTNLA